MYIGWYVASASAVQVQISNTAQIILIYNMRILMFKKMPVLEVCVYILSIVAKMGLAKDT